MKFELVDKKNNSKEIISIAMAGLGLGTTFLLMNLGVLDYEELFNWTMYDNMSDIFCDSLPTMIKNVNLLFGIEPRSMFSFMKESINAIGMNNFFLFTRSVRLMKKVLKPRIRKKSKDNVEDEVQESDSKMEIIAQEKRKEGLENEEEPQALRKLISSALHLGFWGWMMLSGKINYNASYDFSKLPHKFAQIGEIIKGADLNKIKFGSETLGMVFEFWYDRKKEKELGMPLVKPITLKTILKNFPELPSWTDIQSVFTGKSSGRRIEKER